MLTATSGKRSFRGDRQMSLEKFINAKQLAISLAAVIFGGLLALSVPVRAANIVLLECQRPGYSAFPVEIDYDQSTVTFNGRGPYSATITADSITWSWPGINMALNRNTGVMTQTELAAVQTVNTSQCTVKHQERF
jgi:hypothetical protein